MAGHHQAGRVERRRQALEHLGRWQGPALVSSRGWAASPGPGRPPAGCRRSRPPPCRARQALTVPIAGSPAESALAVHSPGVRARKTGRRSSSTLSSSRPAAQKNPCSGKPRRRLEHRGEAAVAGEEVVQPDHHHDVRLERLGSRRPGGAAAHRQPAGFPCGTRRRSADRYAASGRCGRRARPWRRRSRFARRRSAGRSGGRSRPRHSCWRLGLEQHRRVGPGRAAPPKPHGARVAG